MGLNKTKTFRKKRSMSKRIKKRTLKRGKRVVKKMKTRRGRGRSVRRSVRRSSSKRRMKGGKLSPLVPLPLRELGGSIQYHFDKSADIINGTDYTMDPNPTEGQLQHDSI